MEVLENGTSTETLLNMNTNNPATKQLHGWGPGPLRDKCQKLQPGKYWKTIKEQKKLLIAKEISCFRLVCPSSCADLQHHGPSQGDKIIKSGFKYILVSEG